ncbi:MULTISPECIES: HD domain-containing phosphohydrolase [Pelosinus]|uniref:Metal-dependent phosphohydrolase HD sub domain-containing protein n=1 Tax=Pelosinus fermentans B4 TaxID=1149862 RepID=I8RE82_9FIRM|nr:MULTISPECIES: HD domain-containing phosphohydrolase [Pelosinus]EIW15825.1 metal-dependent phosphohydrolase HD sub domain-containing protein [Pelosinus fermentans B4]EIW27469.1 metal dependent phosphohydrolase [Pelosinus fermentans A11]
MRKDIAYRIAQAVHEGLFHGVLVIDSEFRSVFLNQALCDMWKVKQQDVLHHSVLDLFCNGNVKKFGGAYQGPLIETMVTGREISGSEVYINMPGQKEGKWFLVNTFILRDESGQPEYALGNYIVIDKFKVFENKLNAVNMNIIKAFCKAIGVRDIYTMQHSENVAALLVGLTEYMRLSDSEVTMAYLAGIVHDVGKIGISEEILNKPGRLTEVEYEIVKRHPSKGADILQEVDEFATLAHIVRHHHERYDGKGYPNGLQEEAIPRISRMLTICDAYDAMTSVRCYCSPHSVEEALEEIKKCAGGQFDPELSSIFIDFIRECNSGGGMRPALQ